VTSLIVKIDASSENERGDRSSAPGTDAIRIIICAASLNDC